MTENIEVDIISNRPELDRFIDMWKDVKVHKINCTIKVLMLDYPEKKFVLSNGIKVEYIKQRNFPVTSFMNQSASRNELLCYANSEYVLFYDDWQRPGKNILKEHLHYLGKGGIAVCGRRMECNKDGNDCQEDGRNKSGKLKSCSYGLFWTCNASARMGDILKVNGFDNRYNGGTGGEDYDIGMRLERLGNKMIYNPDAKAYHYCHDHLDHYCHDPLGNRVRKTNNHSHNTSAYKYLPEYGHNGNWNLMDGGDLYDLWWEGYVKYFRCKECGIIGILDSMQIYYHNRDNKVIRVDNGLEQIRGILNR